jgi:F-type H+-transporting ATPase subunit delta
MSEKGRLDLVPELTGILAFESKKLSNKFEGTVEADEALPKGELKRLEEVLAKYSGAKIKLKQTSTSGDGLRVSVEDLGLELSFSKARVKSDLLDFIQRAL